MEISGLKVPKIAQEGYKIIAVAALATFVFLFISDVLFYIGLTITLWCAYFFRDPERLTPIDDNLVVSPADGIVQSIIEMEAPKELGLEEGTKVTRIAVFMNVFNVHVNRLPVSGKVTKIVYTPGEFKNVSFDKESADNENNLLVVETEKHGNIGVRQIAGLVARRIVCFTEENKEGQVGEKFGLIRFGSRVDVFLPTSSNVMVKEGQVALSGETILTTFDKKAVTSSEIEYKIQDRMKK